MGHLILAGLRLQVRIELLRIMWRGGGGGGWGAREGPGGACPRAREAREGAGGLRRRVGISPRTRSGGPKTWGRVCLLPVALCELVKRDVHRNFARLGLLRHAPSRQLGRWAGVAQGTFPRVARCAEGAGCRASTGSLCVSTSIESLLSPPASACGGMTGFRRVRVRGGVAVQDAGAAQGQGRSGTRRTGVAAAVHVVRVHRRSLGTSRDLDRLRSPASGRRWGGNLLRQIVWDDPRRTVGRRPFSPRRWRARGGAGAAAQARRCGRGGARVELEQGAASAVARKQQPRTRARCWQTFRRFQLRWNRGRTPIPSKSGWFSPPPHLSGIH